MIFRQILSPDLACASYVLADAGSGVVIDPAWQIEVYLELGSLYGFQITHAIDTHIHADHVSGRESLAAATGARSLLAGDTLSAGDVVQVGLVRLEAIATPGHRPEHVSLLVMDLSYSAEPCLLVAGDSVLAGGLARPDLATADEAELERAARDLLDTIAALGELPDHVEIWPGHIGGALCAVSGLSGRLSSTLGYERRSNPAFVTRDAARFAADLRERLVERPPTVELAVALNSRRGPTPRDPIPRLGPPEVAGLVAEGAAVIDGRSAEVFDTASIPGSFSVPLNGLSVGTRAAWCTDPCGPVVAVGDDDGSGLEVAARLAAVGFQDIRGLLDQGFRSWTSAGLPVRQTGRLEPEEVDRLLADDAVTLVDLRDGDEQGSCFVPGAVRVPWRELGLRGSEAFERGRPVVVACTTGGRTPVAASMLASLGDQPVSRLVNGGIPDLKASVSGAHDPSLGSALVGSLRPAAVGV